MYLVTITAVRTHSVDVVCITIWQYRTTSTPLYELTTLTTYLNDVSLTITTTEVTDPSGTWKVNPNGTITFTPAPGFVGTATLNVQLSGRSGKLYIQPMSVRIAATSRIAIVTGDVPRSISAGVVRTIDEVAPMTYGEFRRLTR